MFFFFFFDKIPELQIFLEVFSFSQTVVFLIFPHLASETCSFFSCNRKTEKKKKEKKPKEKRVSKTSVF